MYSVILATGGWAVVNATGRTVDGPFSHKFTADAAAEHRNRYSKKVG